MRATTALLCLMTVVACEEGPTGPPVGCDCDDVDAECQDRPSDGDACSQADEGVTCGDYCGTGYQLTCEDGEWIADDNDQMCG